MTATDSAINLVSGTGAINVGADAAAHTITLGNVTGATAVNVNTGTGGMLITTTGTGDFAVASADTVLIDSAGVLELNSSAGAINIGNDAVAQAINVGTGAAPRTVNLGTGAAAMTVNVGSTTTTSGTTIQSGTGTMLLDARGGVTIQQAARVGNSVAGYTMDVTGSAGSVAASPAATGGTGGVFSFKGGTGGAAFADAANGVAAGAAGTASFKGGTGGAAAAFDATHQGAAGAGSATTISAGTGGAGASAGGVGQNGAAGGVLTLSGGAGGASGGAGSVLGNGGGLAITGGLGTTNGTITIGNTDTSSVLIASANNRVVTIGSSANTSAVSLRSGSGGVTVGATGGTLTLSTTTSGDLSVTSAGVLSISSTAGDGVWAIQDNSATAFAIGQGPNAYLEVDTTNSAENVKLSSFVQVVNTAGVVIQASGALSAGDVVYAVNNAGTPNASKADGSVQTKLPIGVAYYAAADTAYAKIASVPGTLVPVTMDTSTVAADIGKVVYLDSAAAGRGSLTPPSGSGKVVYRLGIVAGTGAKPNVVWAPQFIANLQ